MVMKKELDIISKNVWISYYLFSTATPEELIVRWILLLKKGQNFGVSGAKKKSCFLGYTKSSHNQLSNYLFLYFLWINRSLNPINLCLCLPLLSSQVLAMILPFFLEKRVILIWGLLWDKFSIPVNSDQNLHSNATIGKCVDWIGDINVHTPGL